MPKKEFDALRKQYSLPTYDELDHEFEIASIESKDHLLRAIRRKIEGRIEQYAKLLEDLVQGDGTFQSLHECQILTDAKKEELYAFYRKMMGMVRYSMMISVDNDFEETAAFIKEAHLFWQKNKRILQETLKEMRDSWNKESTRSEKQEYLG